MALIYYNQRNYGQVYSSKKPPDTAKTIATSGCGPTCLAMIVSNLTKTKVDPPALASYALAKGYRVDGQGTDLLAMSPDVAASYKLFYRRTGKIAEAATHLQEGGMAICNVAGGEQGLFSNEGHFIVLAGITAGTVTVLDPFLYPGKFAAAARAAVKLVGNEAFVSQEALDRDVRRDYDAYYLFLPTSVPIPPRQERSLEENRRIIQARCGFSDPAGVWRCVDAHPFAAALYGKWADSYQK